MEKLFLFPLLHLLAAESPPAKAILGHSLGALLGFEVIRSLAAQGLPQPILFLTSSHAPWSPLGRPHFTISF